MSKKSFSIGIVLGTLAGTAAAYLLAPKSGDKFSSEIKGIAKNAKEKVVVRVDDVMSRSEIWLGEKFSESDSSDEPVRYERTPDNVAPAPSYTEAPDVMIEE